MLGQFCEWLHLLPVSWKLALSAGAVLAPAAIIGTAGALGIRVNLTNSVPIGLYVISNSPEARLLEFCPPEPFGTLSRERGYRERSQLGCPDGARPLLKPVVATVGDVVDVSPRGIEVNGKLIPHTMALHNDSAGRSMSAWPMGTYEVRKGSIWVASSFNAHSFDSRYFGPVPASSVLHHLRPLCVSQ